MSMIVISRYPSRCFVNSDSKTSALMKSAFLVGRNTVTMSVFLVLEVMLSEHEIPGHVFKHAFFEHRFDKSGFQRFRSKACFRNNIHKN